MGQTNLGNSIGRAGPPRARGGYHESWAGRRADHLRRHQRTYGVYHRNPGFALVGISTRARRRAVIGSGKRTKLKPKNDCAAATGRLDGLPQRHGCYWRLGEILQQVMGGN